MNNTLKEALAVFGAKAAELADNYDIYNIKTMPEHLLIHHGLTKKQAQQIRSAFMLNSYRNEATKISTAQDAYSLLSNLYLLEHEEFWAIYIDRSNKPIRKTHISTGGYSSTTVDIRIIFRDALINRASGIILAHNHPSGNLQPSIEDKRITGKIAEAGELFNINILDHLIVSSQGYYSFADNGLL
jgi:DNA repair protein RadC